MKRVENLQRIFKSGIIAVIRGAQPEKVQRIALALGQGGVEVLEVTVDSPGAMDTIEQVSQNQEGALVGAGTVLDAETARTAILAGAQFIFTPTLDVRVIEVANRYDRVVIPGVMTPTEMLAAYQAGALAVKVFPAQVLGPDFIRQVRGPLGHIPMIPTGGIDEGNVIDFIAAGAAGVGIGGALVGRKAIEDDDYEGIAAKARRFVQLVQKARAKG
ncbi:MAG: bifunctional 4-hydroxy-2-oxoglutarate aldolase/2-dehydro-3-deoxy-phosphogluconate aldolase [Limnochordia bacterium]